MDDEMIITLFWKRDENAIKETKRKYGNYCRHIAHNILNNKQDAEECENDTYLDAWNEMPPSRPFILSANKKAKRKACKHLAMYAEGFQFDYCDSIFDFITIHHRYITTFAAKCSVYRRCFYQDISTDFRFLSDRASRLN